MSKILNTLKVHHLGIACKSIEKSLDNYKAYKTSNEFIDTSQKVKILFLYLESFPTLELIEPLSKDSPVDAILIKNDEVTYHTCYEVNDIESCIQSLKEENFIQVTEIIKAPALDNKNICFMFNTSVGLIELVEL